MRAGRWDRSMALVSAALVSGLLLPGAAVADEPPPSVPVPTPPSQADVEVVLQRVRFSPEEITIRVGDTVTWTHRDSQLSHHVGSHDGSFDSHPTCGRPFGTCMKGGQTYSHTFDQPGRYEYHCRPHASSHHDGMIGAVTVVG